MTGTTAHGLGQRLEALARTITRFTGSTTGFTLQLKLNEIVAALEGASNRLVNIEDLTEAELNALHLHYARLATMAKRDVDLMQSHSVDEAASRHERKHGPRNRQPPS